MWAPVHQLLAQISAGSWDPFPALTSLGVGAFVAAPVAFNNRSLRQDLATERAANTKLQQAAVDRERELSGATLAQVVQSVSAIREVQAALTNTATRPAVDLDALVARLDQRDARKGQRDRT